MTTLPGDDPDHNTHRTELPLLHNSASPSENWDDDFEFQAGVVAGARDSAHDAMNAHTSPRQSLDQEESWDDAYEDENTPSIPVKRASKVEEDDVEDWDSSDNELENHDHHQKNPRHDQTREFGMGGFEEEDKTVTARSTSSQPRVPLPVLPLPIPPAHSGNLFQAHTVLPTSTTSPTLSTFSIPLSSTTRDRASIYSQDPLMPTSNSSAPHLSVMRSYPHAAGSTPPRKGRRLRKKSRPPEADIFELEDHEPNPIPVSVPPPAITTDQNILPTTPPRAQQTILDSPSGPSQPSGPPTPSSSLLTRIGSFKRWARRSIGPDDPVLSGWRRSKSSTGPSEAKSSHGPSDVISRGGKSSTGPEGRTSTEDGTELRLRPASPTPAPRRLGRRSRGESASGQKSGWFFRAGGAAGSEREEVTPTAQTPELTPSKRGTALGLRRRSKVRGEGEEDVDGEKPLTPRKFKARLVPALKSEGSAGLHRHGEPKSPTRPSRRSPSRDATDCLPQSGKRPMSMLFPRHGNGNASIGRKAGIPVAESASAGSALLPVRDGASGDEKTHVDSRDKEGGREGGMRSLMNGVRRLSLVGANSGHKRTKSTGGEDGAEESPRKDGANRPRSQTDHYVGGLKVDQASLQSPILRLAPHHGDGNGLLPPVELEPSSMAGIFARRGSLPWADYDRTSGAESHAGASTVSALKPPPAIVADHQHLPPHRQSCSTVSSSSSSRNASSGNLDLESQMKHSHSPTASVPLLVPIPSKPADAVPQSRPLASTAPTEHHSGFESRYRVPVHPQSPPKFPMPTSPQSASLGRSTASPSHPAGLRRNSLGDLKTPLNTLGEHKAQLPPLGELKIPARISRAQQGLRRDMGMVKEFAGCVEQLKRLQVTYIALLGDLRAAYEASPGTSPPGATHVQFHLPSRPPSQVGSHRKTITSNSNPSVQSIHQTVSLNSPTQIYPLRTASRASQDISRELVRLEHEYGIWWECAELLIELGGGSGVAGAASYPNLATLSTSTVNTPAAEDPLKLNSTEEQQPILKHVSSMSEPGSLFEQGLSSISNSKGPPQASPPHLSQWRASTGRHDLSARQLRLLRDMLNTPDPASLAYAAGPYGYGAGYPHSHLSTTAEAPPWVTWNPSIVTLPSEESSADAHSHGAPPATETREEGGKEKKRRASKLGMLGLREILRGLKRTAVAEGRLDTLDRPVQGHQGSESTACHIAEDDHYNRRRSPWHQHDEHHAAKLSTGPELTAPMDHPPTRTHPPKSPRRPSLASIFRIGNKNMKSANVNGKLIRDGDASPKENGNSTPEEERMSPLGSGAAGEYADWDRMSRSDLDLTAVGSGTATVRAKKLTRVSASHSGTNLNYPYANGATPKKTPATSQTSLRDLSPSSAASPQPSRLPLSIVEESGSRNTQRAKTPDVSRPKDGSKTRTSSWSQAHPPRPVSRTGKTAISGTVRSAPPNDLSSATPASKLALTPENIKPLLEYAKEVGTRLSECISEVQILLGAGTIVS